MAWIIFREGAEKIFAVEASSHMADICEEVIVMNGFGKSVKVINKDVRHVSAIKTPNGAEAEMEQKADILVLEVFPAKLWSHLFLQRKKCR